MVDALLTGFFKILLSIINVFLTPLNSLLTSIFPNISTKITELTSMLNTIFDYLVWPISILPPILRTTLLFTFGINLTMITVKTTYRLVIKVPKILQQLKFW